MFRNNDVIRFQSGKYIMMNPRFRLAGVGGAEGGVCWGLWGLGLVTSWIIHAFFLFVSF